MSRNKFGAESGHLTKWIPVGEIEVDPVVQRPLNTAWAEKIGRELDPDLMGVLHVSKRPNGCYVCIDGQHRLYGVKNVFGNNGTLVECKVYEGLSKAQEAEFFVGLNDFRRPTRIDVFLKNVIAKDPDTVAIAEILKALDFRVERYKSEGTITAVGALEEVYFGFANIRDPSLSAESRAAMVKPELLRSTLRVIKQAWGSNADGMNGFLISGIGRVLAARQRVMQVDDFVHKLAGYPGGPMGIIGAAQGRKSLTGGRTGINVAEVCVDLYNKGRRVGKLEPLR